MQKTKLNVRGRTKVLEKDAEYLQNELQGLKMALEIGREDRGKALKSGYWKSGKSGPIINYVKHLSGKDDRIIDPVNLDNIKFLKYENPRNDAKLPVISKEEKTLKEFIKHSLGPKKKPSAKSLRCGQCEEKSANVNCVECGEDYCASCFVVFHLKGALKKHRSRPVGAESLRTPRHDVLARNVTGSPDEARPNKTFAPGIQQVSSAPTAKTRTQSSCSTTSCNNNNNNSHYNRNNITCSNNTDNSTSSLMNGRFDEEESALSFQKALHEWRVGHKESGSSKEDLMLHRNVKTVPSQEIAVGTMSSPVVSPPKLDDLAEDLERKIQKTCMLAYSDKLLLKKLRRSEFSTSFIRETKSCLSVFSKISAENGDGDVSEEPKSDYDVQMAASESNLAQIIHEFGKKTSDSNVPVSNQFRRIKEIHNTNQNSQETHNSGGGDCDDGGYDDDGDAAERRSSLLIEDLHSSRSEQRHFPTKIEPNTRKISENCFHSRETNDQENIKKGLAAPSSTAKASDHYQELMISRGINSPNINGKLNNKVSTNERKTNKVKNTNQERKTSENSLQTSNKAELHLNLEETSDPEDGRTSQNSVATSRTTTNRSNVSKSSRNKNKKTTFSRPTSRITSARLASERGKLNKNVSDEISFIANLKDDDDAVDSIETSLDALFMAGIPPEERSILTTSGKLGQAVSSPQVSARSKDILSSARAKDGFKISNQFYQVKQKTWRPNADHSHLSEEFSDEALKSFREIMDQLDDDKNKVDDNSDNDDVDDDDHFHIEEAHFEVDKDKSGLSNSTQFDPSHWSEKQFHEKSINSFASLRDCTEENDELKTASGMNEDLSELKSSFSRFSTEEEMIMKFFNASKDEGKVESSLNIKTNPRSESDELFISKMSARFKGTSSLESKVKKTRFSPDVKDASVDDSSPRHMASTTKFSISPTQKRQNMKQGETSWPAPRQSKNVPVQHKGYSNTPLIVTGRSVTLVSPSESRCLSSSSKPDVVSTNKTLEKNLMKMTDERRVAGGYHVTGPVSSAMSVQSHDEEAGEDDDAKNEEEKDQDDDDDDDDDEEEDQRVFLDDNMTRYDDMDLERLTIDEEELDQFVRLEKTCIEGLHPGSRKAEVLLSNETSNSRHSLESMDDNETNFEDKLELVKRFNNLDLLLSSSSDDVDEEEDIEAVKSLR